METEGAAPDLLAASGAAVALGADLVLDLGTLHPSAHGAFRVRLRVDGDTVVAAEPLPGLLHRGAEKLFEVRDYRQVVALADRHDWLAGAASETGVALAVERMLGLEVPERATWLRTALAELTRVTSALLFLAATLAVDEDPAAVPAYAAREALLLALESWTGSRLHPAIVRVGGLASDAPAGWADTAMAAATTARAALADLGDRLSSSEVTETTAGVATLSRDDAVAYGVSGPVARASGLDLDVRRDDPYLAYADLAADGLLAVPTATAGDAHARLTVLLAQVPVALALLEAALERAELLRGGAVDVRLPKVVRVPQGETYVWTENPTGVNGYYLASTGDRVPWRLKVRSASFNNVQAMTAALPGTRLDALVPALMSFFFVVGDLDR